MRGSLQFVDQQTQAVTNTVNYTIPAQSYFRFQTAGTASSTQSGFVRIVPANNGTTPAAFGIFSFRQNGVTVSETALTAVPGSTAYRVYAENSSTTQTGIAIANLSADPITVNLDATTLTGESAGLSGTLTISGNGQIATFLSQIPGFENIGTSFQGVLRVWTGSASGIAVAGLRGRTNERGDFLVATIPSVDETASTPRVQLAFPHYVQGAGYTTQFVFFAGRANSGATGILRLFDQSGTQINVQ